jgi:hypothetical protein
MRLFLIALMTILAGCETSAAWYASHPEKRTLQIDGTEVYVVPRGNNKFDAWGGDEGVKTNAAVTKARQIKAVEQASKCSVSASEYLPGTATLQTVVACP